MTGFSIDQALEVVAVERHTGGAYGFGREPLVEVTASRAVDTGTGIAKAWLVVPMSDQPAIGDTITITAELEHQAYPDPEPDSAGGIDHELAEAERAADQAAEHDPPRAPGYEGIDPTKPTTPRERFG